MLLYMWEQPKNQKADPCNFLLPRFPTDLWAHDVLAEPKTGTSENLALNPSRKLFLMPQNPPASSYAWVLVASWASPTHWTMETEASSHHGWNTCPVPCSHDQVGQCFPQTNPFQTMFAPLCTGKCWLDYEVAVAMPAEGCTQPTNSGVSTMEVSQPAGPLTTKVSSPATARLVLIDI